MGRLLSFKAHREGAFSWLPPAALLAALAMLLITMGTAPSAAEESPDPETGIRVEGSESENTGAGEERPPGKKTLEQNKVGDADPEVPAPEGRGEEDAESGGFFGSLINAVQSLILAPFAANNDIVVNIESHEKIGAGTDIFIGDTVKITGTWDARNANPRAGDTFRIDFGSQFKVDGVSVDLPGPEQSTGDILNWGTCLPAGENSLECTLTDSVEGRENIHGTWGATVTAISVGELVEDAGVRIDSKRGTMLYDPVTLGGVTHPAGTVTRWEIKLSGEGLVGRTEPITITDIFDPKLQVCEAEGDLRSALGLDAEHPDSVMQTVLDEVQHHGGENTLTFRILPPAEGYTVLSVPTLRYYLCTTSGGMDAAGSTYENLAHTGEDGPTISAKITQDRSYVGTGTGVNRGSFSLRKVLAEDSEQPDFGQIENSFTVKYEEFTLDAYAAGEDPEYVGQLNISADGEAVSGIHARGSGWIIRLSEIQFPEVPGMKWENPVFTGGENLTYETEGDPSVALVTTGPGSNVEVLLSNNLQPFEPWIGTTAEVTGDAPKLLPLTGGEVVDTVAYRDLVPETEYRLEGEIMHVALDGTVTSTGVQAEADFVTPAATAGETRVSGTTEVTFQIDGPIAQRYAGEQLVVFERLFNPAGENPEESVATHEDPEDEAQSFRVEEAPEGAEPWIGTTAEVSGAQDKLLPITGGEVVDTVAYRDLVPETEYRLEGEIMHVAPDGTVTSTGVQATATFTTPESTDDSEYVSGTTKVTFQIDGTTAQRYAGEHLVVFERLFNPVGENPEESVATHEDPEDEAQSFRVEEAPEDDPEDPEEPEETPVETPTPTPEAPQPWIGTTAEVTGAEDKILPITGGEVVDTVAYRDLKPETEYRLEGEIMHVALDGTVTSTGVQATATFTTPESTDDSEYVSGTTEVVFEIDGTTAQRYAGEKLVVFEKLFNPAAESPEKPVATHEDPEDEAQSFQVEEEPGEEIIITKTVTGPKGREIEADPDAVFQIRASWTDAAGEEYSELINVTPGEPTSLRGLPANTEITLSEVGAATGVSNVRWGDVRWSGEGVVDAQGSSRDATVILSEENTPLQVSLENRTSSNGLILIPLPIPLPPGDGPAGPPSPDIPDLPDAPGIGKVVPETPVHHGEPAGVTPTVPAEPTAPTAGGKEPVSGALASTGANVGWVAGGALLLLLAGAGLFLRGRELKS